MAGRPVVGTWAPDMIHFSILMFRQEVQGFSSRLRIGNLVVLAQMPSSLRDWWKEDLTQNILL